MRCVVTGGTGFLGTNLAHVLERDPAVTEVRLAALPGSETEHTAALPKARFVPCDVTSADDVGRAVAGADVVFHLAGDTSFWGARYAQQRRINVEGTRNVCEACSRAGVRRVVHVSTVDVMGAGPGGEVLAEADAATEDARYSYRGYGYNYADTKREAEALALSYNRPGGVEVVACRPAMMIGPYDHTLQFGRLFLDILAGEVPAVPGGGTSCAHVVAVARALVAAATRGRPGVCYNLAGPSATYKELFGAIAARVDCRAPSIVAPRWALVVFGYFAEKWADLVTGQPPSINPGMARYMSALAYYSSERAERELGFERSSLDQMLDDCHRWYLANGKLPAPAGRPRGPSQARAKL